MKAFLVGAILAALLVQPIAGSCGGELDSFVGSLNVQANADLPGFKVKLSAQFGIPVPQVETVIARVQTPADAYMVLKVGQVAAKPQEVVLKEYQANKGKGWGVIAKSLGIKPGSAEFHALKRGDLAFTGEPAASVEKGPGKGKGRGRGHNK
ncbi:MAG TPA: hypothetical protein VIU40_05615 [Geobacteraceae bacterium]